MLAQKRAKIDEKAEVGTKATIYKAIDGVYMSPQARDAAADVAYSVYAKLKTDGVDDLEKAIRISTGGVIDYNGTKVAKPYGMDDSKFRDSLKNSVVIPPGEYHAGGMVMNPEALQKSLPGAKLQTYGDGSYMVKSGADVVRLADGRPFIFKVSQ